MSLGREILAYTLVLGMPVGYCHSVSGGEAEVTLRSLNKLCEPGNSSSVSVGYFQGKQRLLAEMKQHVEVKQYNLIKASVTAI